MWKGKWHFRSDIKRINYGVNHMPFKKGPQQEKGSLADQIREKIFEHIAPTPVYDIDFLSKTFWQIRLRELRDPDYTVEDIRGFFSALDFVSEVYVVVNDKRNPFVTNDSLFVVKLGHQKHIIPVSIFWLCLSQTIRNKFKHKGSFFTIYSLLFSAYWRKLISTENE